MAFTLMNENGPGYLAGSTHELKGKETLDWLFLSDDQTDTSLMLYQNKDAVRIYDVHPVYDWMHCVDLSTIQGSGKESNKWILRATYERLPEPESEKPKSQKPPTKSTPVPVPGEKDPGDLDEDDEPPNFDPQISITFEEFSKPLRSAFTAVEAQSRAFKVPIKGSISVVNSALAPYDPPPEVQEQFPIIDIRANVLTTSSLFSVIGEYGNRINTDAFRYVEGKYELKVTERAGRMRYTIGPTIKYFDNRDLSFKFYRELNIQIVVKENGGWTVDPLDYGSYYVETELPRFTIQERIDASNFAHQTDAQFIPFEDANRQPILGLLDGKGDELADGSPPFFNSYKGYFENQFLPLLKKVSSQRFKK